MKFRWDALGVVALSILLLLFSLPAEAQGTSMWTVTYYPNPRLTGGAVYHNMVPTISFDWGNQPPVPDVSTDRFSLRATRTAYFYDGMYTFYVTGAGNFVLYLDGQPVIDAWPNLQPGKTYVASVPLNAHWAALELDYSHTAGRAFLYATWTYTTANEPTPLPTPAGPTPEPVESVTELTTTYGNFTPCIRQNVHQAECFESTGRWNAPNIGSIRLEPQIIVWGPCRADRITEMVVYEGQPEQRVKCSKSLAGWYPA